MDGQSDKVSYIEDGNCSDRLYFGIQGTNGRTDRHSRI